MSTYSEIYDIAAPVFDNWESWFDPDAPDDVFPDDLVYPIDKAIADLDEGITHWQHPGWIRDMVEAFRDWSIGGNLIRAQLTAEWLLTTVPTVPLDSDFVRQLQLMANGDFCEVFAGESCIYPRKPEFYASTLNWKMVTPARAAIQEICPSAMEWMP